jgi:hypothetical protein
MRATVDEWKWFWDYKKMAYAQNDAQKIQLVEYYLTGQQYFFDDPQRAIHLFEAGHNLARILVEPYWELFFNYWCSEVYLFGFKDLQKALEKSVQSFVLAHQAPYQNSPFIGRVYFELMSVHYTLDAEGYADQIRAMMAYMSDNVRLDKDTVLLLQRYRAGLHYTFEEWDKAEVEILKYLEMSRGTGLRESTAYSFLMYLMIETQRYEEFHAYALQLEKSAARINRKQAVATALLARAVYALKHGQPAAAENFNERAWTILNGQNYAYEAGIYNLSCAYQETKGDAEAALKLRDRQLANLVGKRNYQFESSCRLNRCRLLGRMGRAIDQEISGAYESIKMLRTTTTYLKYLKEIEQGDYSDPYTLWLPAT